MSTTATSLANTTLSKQTSDASDDNSNTDTSTVKSIALVARFQTSVDITNDDSDDDNDTPPNIGAATNNLHIIRKNPNQTSSTTIPIPQPKPVVVINKIHCILLKNINCWAGILVYLLCIFLTIVSIFYALGQITSLEVVDFFCPDYTEEQVRQHSIENGLNQGDPGSCWKTKSFRVKYSSCFLKSNHIPL